MNKKIKKTAFCLPHWGPYDNTQRQLLVLWNWFERLCNEGKMTWARTNGNPFDKGGNGTIEAGCGCKNAVFFFKVENGLIVRGSMF